MGVPLDFDEAKELDGREPLTELRNEFEIPKHFDGTDQAYFAGNSLGLLPKRTRPAIKEALDQWGGKGVGGHFDGEEAWYRLDERIAALQTGIVGCLPSETGIMGSLTTNLHMLMASFYRPTVERQKILIEPHAFPSDRYAVAAQVAWHGGNPNTDVITIKAENPDHLTPDDLERTLHHHKDISLALLGGVNYYTGQFLDIASMSPILKSQEITFGLDLAHAVGNVPLELHDWGIDFASWCTYKYLNSGPGAVAGAFVHERHVGDDAMPRFEGWWGHNAKRRFLMEPQFDSMGTAEAWQMSNAPVFNMAIHAIALEQFTAAGMAALRAKSLRLTAYLEAGIAAVAKHNGARLEVITPANPARRGCQLSLVAHGFGQELFQALTDAGVVVDWREPNVIRMAPVPMYNTFEDIARFVHILKSATQPH